MPSEGRERPGYRIQNLFFGFPLGPGHNQNQDGHAIAAHYEMLIARTDLMREQRLLTFDQRKAQKLRYLDEELKGVLALRYQLIDAGIADQLR